MLVKSATRPQNGQGFPRQIPKDRILIDNHTVHLQHVFYYKLLPQHTPLIYKRLDFQRLSVQICRAFQLLFVSPILLPQEKVFCRFPFFSYPLIYGYWTSRNILVYHQIFLILLKQSLSISRHKKRHKQIRQKQLYFLGRKLIFDNHFLSNHQQKDHL